MSRTVGIAFIFLLAIAIGAPNVPIINTVVGVEQAFSQERKRKTLFEILFKRRKNTNRVTTSSRTRNQNLSDLPGVNLIKRQKPKPQEVEAPAAPIEVVVKNENAATILVVGDFIAKGLAKGLEKFYAENANFRVVSSTNHSSGIVRDDVVDWPARVPELIDEFKPVAVIALVGMNDRQQMRLESGRVDKFSEAWKTEYKKRITSIASSGRNARIPVIWMGLPPVKSNKMNADYLVFNEMARTISESIGGTFVDIWDGFTNAEGKFVSAGPDVNGQIVRLRGSKGINMTRAGKAKLAFFADKALRKIGIVGNPEGFEYASLGTINPNLAQPGVPEYDPAGSGKTIVISLGSPTLDGGDVLEGEADFMKSEDNKKSVSFDLVESGLPKELQQGRVDSAWGTPKKVSANDENTSEQAATTESDSSAAPASATQ